MDVAVIGGGAVGLAVAWRAATSGQSVVLADPAPGGGASHVAAGMLAPVGEAHFGEQRLLTLNLESWRRYPAFCSELEAASGRPAGYLASGTVLVARDSDENAALEREYRFRLSLGLEVERLSAGECRSYEPGLAPSTRGGVLAPGDHQVDPRMLTSSLLAACGRAGVGLVGHSAAVVLEGGRVSGIRLDDGTVISVACVVVAAGCWSPLVDGIPTGAIPPIRPVKGQLLRLKHPSAARVTSRIVRGLDVYVVPRADGTVVVGSTVEERGFDTTVTAGAVHQLLRDAIELVPDVAELELVEAAAGLRPGTPDNAPLIGESSIPGLILATGHYRNGVLLTPVTADAVAAVLCGRPVPDAVAPFTPLRFERRAEVVA